MPCAANAGTENIGTAQTLVSNKKTRAASSICFSYRKFVSIRQLSPRGEKDDFLWFNRFSTPHSAT
jgi:hypothetical protein